MSHMSLKTPRVLWFILGPIPSKADREGAAAIAGAHVMFRNAKEDCGGALEECEGVEGAVPEPYRTYPNAERAVAAYKAQIGKMQQLAGDSPAPVQGVPIVQPKEPKTTAAGWTPNAS